ncbi:hypothetical protein COU78_07030 [Candidatus Peregrinibacteria bacterium CG10_big_fil_rev_8_21_14_0_10_49_24]|nr:MAG: hypothetical protein COV83_05900 [Candidatus Peregrinibacteria bacterium CG11_big_fil_rev_8_21_14_0_20_49_14]PIR50355.1 MAG: hypothetical protein COU78_07030 [Candidatus Peregrinibacteria bacterium CG10_big_fil_rev_8_21_14_0_10_49_24]PJA67765.1 MAG: hypothetical protein CO157_02750 [Candidatus Peregrinibacteria bacterium CG_4_9_14_3_um_filter_49_12]
MPAIALSLGEIRNPHRWKLPVLLGALLCGLWIFNVFIPGKADVEQAIISITITNTSGSGFTLNLIAAPEKRVPSANNDDTRLEIEVRAQGSSTALYRQVVRTSSGGTFSGFTVSGLSAGTYDITAKGYSHLRKKKASITLSTGATIDFTSSGTDKLLSGDVNSSSGDNLVNGIDLTLIIGDLTGSTERYDLNRDSVVNGIDLTNAITNLTQTGDT